MKSFTNNIKEIAKQSSALRQMSDEELRKLKNVLLSMYIDIDKLCRENNLDLILVGGSALGAARHKGFIPWDDDLDLALSRDQYNKLIQLLEDGNLNDKYDFTVPSSEKDSKNLFLKIYKKNTLNAEIMDLNTPFPKGIFIDVFPIENAVKPGFRNHYRSFLLRLIGYISSSVLYYKYPNRVFKEFMYSSQEGRTWYRINQTIGFIFSFLSHKKWIKIYDKYSQYKFDSGYLTIPSGRGNYSGETLPRNIFFPVKEIEFESYIAKIPNDLDSYLKNLYGEYKIIPPPDKRERHYIVDLQF